MGVAPGTVLPPALPSVPPVCRLWKSPSASTPGAPRTPPGFYSEPSRDPTLFFSIRHIKNTDLDSAAAADPGHAEYEVCATSWPDARQALAAIGNPNHTLASTKTPEVYEFEQSVDGQINRRSIHRVFDCAFVDRSSVNLRAANGSGGLINRRPVDPDSLRFLAEYTFLFSIYNNVGYLVVASEGETDPAQLLHRVTVAELQPGSGPSECDRLALFDLRYAADPSSGAVEFAEEFLWEILVMEASGRAESCD